MKVYKLQQSWSSREEKTRRERSACRILIFTKLRIWKACCQVVVFWSQISKQFLLYISFPCRFFFRLQHLFCVNAKNVLGRILYCSFRDTSLVRWPYGHFGHLWPSESMPKLLRLKVEVHACLPPRRALLIMFMKLSFGNMKLQLSMLAQSF